MTMRRAIATFSLLAASLLLGATSSGTVNIVAGNSLQNWYYAGYIQDDFQVTKHLTLNLGFRYENESPYTERRDQIMRTARTNLKSESCVPSRRKYENSDSASTDTAVYSGIKRLARI